MDSLLLFFLCVCGGYSSVCVCMCALTCVWPKVLNICACEGPCLGVFLDHAPQIYLDPISQLI